jgi:hypothetical protein
MSRHWSLLTTIGVAALLCSTSPALAQTRLGTAASFAILAATPNVTNIGPSVVIGNRYPPSEFGHGLSSGDCHRSVTRR